MTLSLSVWISIVGLMVLIISEGYTNYTMNDRIDKSTAQYLIDLKKNYEIHKITRNRIEIDI